MPIIRQYLHNIAGSQPPLNYLSYKQAICFRRMSHYLHTEQGARNAPGGLGQTHVYRKSNNQRVHDYGCLMRIC